MMRKYIIGMLVGAALTFSFQAGAATLVGSKVTKTMEVKLDGNTIGQAPVIGGVGYLPIRTMSNNLNLGLEVKGNTINLAMPDETPPKFPYTMMEIDASIDTINRAITLYQSQVDGYVNSGKADDPVADSLRSAIITKQAELVVWLERKSLLEALETP